MDFLQLGYVTNDFDRALQALCAAHGITSMKIMREVHLPTRPGQEVVAHFGLAFKHDTQIELIEPLAGDVALFRSVLPEEGYGLRLHHVGQCIESPVGYQDALAAGRSRWDVMVDVQAFGGAFAYLDARAELGHYLELFCFPTATYFADVPRF